MLKSSFSLMRFALAMSIVLTSLTPISSLAGSSELCRDFFKGEPAYQRANPSARMSGQAYPMPNARTMNEYEISLLPPGVRFRDLLRRNAVIVDVGGGKGRAMAEIAQSLPVHSIVINTQDFSPLYRGARFKGEFEYRAGWAEEILKEIPTGSVDMVVDLWGGFTYSPNKVEILQEIYRILKPGGRAFVLSSTKSPTHVEDPAVNYGQPVQLDWYLSRKFKDSFSSRAAHHPDIASSKIIEITKPLSGEPATIDVNLVQVEVTRNERLGRSASLFSNVTYGAKP